MGKYSKENKGLQLLMTKYRSLFRIPENVNYYSAENYKKAEKKYLKHILKGDL
jgi:hypothetical protein